MPRLPPRYAPYAYAVIQAAITTGVATAIATHQLTGPGLPFLSQWAFAWCLAWITMLPVVLFFAPLILRAVGALTARDAARGTGERREG
jgi:hypothetical protein